MSDPRDQRIAELENRLAASALVAFGVLLHGKLSWAVSHVVLLATVVVLGGAGLGQVSFAMANADATLDLYRH
ncbi:MAG: hypothetical protein AMXMBFR34_36220 [Myxococcaceae bacterium]